MLQIDQCSSEADRNQNLCSRKVHSFLTVTLKTFLCFGQNVHLNGAVDLITRICISSFTL